MIDLLHQYRRARGDLRKMHEYSRVDEDKKAINSMIDDVTFIIDWIESGSNPEEYRGTNLKNAYHIKYLPSMEILPDITEQLTIEREPLQLTNEQKHIIRLLFDSWTDRERDCFILYMAENKSMNEISELLNISKASVQTYIKRAKEKVDIIKEKTKQLILF